MKGLTTEEVLERVEKGQVNLDAAVKTKSVGQIVFENTCTLFNLVNVLLAICVCLVHSYRNMLFLGVVVSNLLIGIVQELRAKFVMDRLTLLSEAHITVVRDGQQSIIPMHEIVQDDLILLKSGMQVCADVVIEQGECEVNESLLTGESDSIEKKAGEMLLSGSYLVSGSVYAIVQKVGADSYANQLTSGVKKLKDDHSEIKRSVMKIIKLVSIVICFVAPILFWNQFTLNDSDTTAAVVNTVAALLGMIPEGLVLLTSIVMAVSVVRLAKKQTLVQQMYSVETLARVDVFCLDKTGTLTKGEMLLKAAESLCEQDFTEPLSEMMGVFPNGNATFQAIERVYCKKSWQVEEVIPFSSERKWSAASFDKKGTYVLGAPEFVLPSMSDELLKKIESHVIMGERVLLFARTRQSIQDKKLPQDLEPLAVLFLEDIIKDNAPDTIDYLKKQDVELKIISGDNPKAVSAIARRVGIEDYRSYIDCSKVESLEELAALADKKTIFGRVSPQQKKCLIEALKAQKHTVAMTGDGVNDVLALKEADCSIAMQSGSEAARNISDMVLMNSDFQAIPAIIAEGRRSINNLQRSSSLFLIKTVFSVILAVIFCFLNNKYPYQPIQMSLISSTCIGIPSFVLAFERNTERVTSGFLKKVFRVALPGGILMAGNVLFCVLFGDVLQISHAEISTLATCMGGLVFAIILYKICTPFNMLRMVLYGALWGLFLISIVFAGEVFYFTELSFESYAVMVMLEIANVAVFHRLQNLISNILDGGK